MHQVKVLQVRVAMSNTHGLETNEGEMMTNLATYERKLSLTTQQRERDKKKKGRKKKKKNSSIIDLQTVP